MTIFVLLLLLEFSGYCKIINILAFMTGIGGHYLIGIITAVSCNTYFLWEVIGYVRFSLHYK
mgnify:CR=1 FL=1